MRLERKTNYKQLQGWQNAKIHIFTICKLCILSPVNYYGLFSKYDWITLVCEMELLHCGYGDAIALPWCWIYTLVRSWKVNQISVWRMLLKILFARVSQQKQFDGNTQNGMTNCAHSDHISCINLDVPKWGYRSFLNPFTTLIAFRRRLGS